MFQAPKMSWFTLSVIFAFRLIFISGGVYAGSQEPFFPIQQHLEGPSSEYTDRLIRWAQKWPPRGLILEAQRGDSPVLLECLETLGKLDYIGIQQQMTIRAPLSRVEAILDDIDHYQDLFSGFETIRVESKNGNQILTYWEQKVPLFFIPNVKYKMTYLIDKSSLQRKFYRYQLSQMRRTSRCPIASETVEAMRYGSTPISKSRVTVVGASFVCTVESTR